MADVANTQKRAKVLDSEIEKMLEKIQGKGNLRLPALSFCIVILLA